MDKFQTLFLKFRIKSFTKVIANAKPSNKLNCAYPSPLQCDPSAVYLSAPSSVRILLGLKMFFFVHVFVNTDDIVF